MAVKLAAPEAPAPTRGAPPKNLGQLIESAPQAQDGGAQPLDLSSLAGGAQAAAAAAPAADSVPPITGDPASDYKASYELFVNGQYAPAETAFRQFLAAYPGDPRSADANYWLGQSLFSRGMYREAAVEFVKMGGPQALITDPANLVRAIRGETGTRIVPG